MEFGPLLRGEGKIYIALSSEVSTDTTLLTACQTSRGDAMPAIVLRKPTAIGKWILVLPLVQCDLLVRIEAFDVDWNTVDTCEQRVKPFSAAIHSKINSFKLGAEAEAIRDADVDSFIEQAHIHIDRIIHDQCDCDEDIVHATITALFSCESDTSPAVKVFGEKGVPAEIKDFMVLSDEATVHSKGEPFVRTMHVSFRKPGSLWEFFCWASFNGEGAPDGFISVGDHVVRRVYREHFGNFDLSGDGGRYHDWFIEHHKTPAHILAVQRTRAFEIEPLFSFIVPLYKTPVEYFEEMVDSIISQTYPRWELVLVNASPDNAELREAVDRRIAEDGRITLVELAENLGITENTNAGIRAANGDFICFFDHDDVIEPDILFEYVDGINRYPDTDLLYCDEDKLLGGRYVGGFFKPDYDPVLMLATNLVCHMLTVRKSIIDGLAELPGEEFDGSQDHNMTLVASEHARNIYHARKILYHWRIHEGSAALGPGEKPWTLESGRLAVQQHLDRMGIAATVANYPGEPNVYAVDFELDDESTKASFIVSADDADELERCLDAISEHAGSIAMEAVVLWRGDKAEDVRSACRTEERTFAVSVDQMGSEEKLQHALNRTAHACNGSHLVFLDQSVKIASDGWIERLAGLTRFDGVAVVVPRILYRDGTVRQNGLVMSGGKPVRLLEFSTKDWTRCYVISRFMRCITAAEADCMVVDRVAFESVGGFDESFKTSLFGIDFCQRLRADGKLIAVEQRAEAYCDKFPVCANEGLQIQRKARPRAEDAALAADYAKLMTSWPRLFSDMDGNYAGEYLPGSSSFELYIPKDSVALSLA